MDAAHAKKTAQMLAAIGEPLRLQIIEHLMEGPKNVGALAETVGIPMVNMSHHLGVLKTAGLADDQKDGRKVVYSLHSDVFDAGTHTLGLGSITIKFETNGKSKSSKK